MKSKLGTYIISLIISVGTGAVSALLTRGNMDIYNDIRTPPLSPPSFLFPIVWSILYILMGISAAMIYTSENADTSQKNSVLRIYAASLFVNFLWSIVFFNFRAFLTAFIVLLLLLYLIVRTISGYNTISPVAAKLQIPYALWVAFAGYLNLGIYFLNK